MGGMNAGRSYSLMRQYGGKKAPAKGAGGSSSQLLSSLLLALITCLTAKGTELVRVSSELTSYRERG